MKAFVAKRMEIRRGDRRSTGKSAVKREVPQKGDVVLLLGGRTGRDGLGGATGSSKEHTEQNIHQSGAEVQKGESAYGTEDPTSFPRR